MAVIHQTIPMLDPSSKTGKSGFKYFWINLISADSYVLKKIEAAILGLIISGSRGMLKP